MPAFISRLLHLGSSGNWGNCGPDCTALARLEKCLIDDMMPLYDSGKCYPLFEQGPCNDGEWFVLNSAAIEINGRLLPYPHCEKVTYCDGELETDYEGKDILFTNYLNGNYIFILKKIFSYSQVNLINL